MSHTRLRLRTAAIIMATFLSVSACGSVSESTPAGTARAAPLVHLPADQAAHSRVHNEWWYLVGHLHRGGRTFGFETTVFKFKNVRAPGFSTPLDLYRTDIAITNESQHSFHQKVTYLFPGTARFSTSTLNVRVGTVSLTGSSPSSMHLKSSMPGGSIDLTLSSRRPPMDVGGRGYIPFGNGFTYYYSLTDLKTRGRLSVAGRTYRVSGVSWLDHQWGNWSWQAIHGWTWMALQLNDGTQLSVFDFRGQKRVKAASVLLAGGRTRTDHGITISSTGKWRSPHTGAVYPSGWTVRVPGERGMLHVTPTVRDQELTVPSQAGGSYWEGSGRITGTWRGKRVTGQSYTELTGYAGG